MRFTDLGRFLKASAKCEASVNTSPPPYIATVSVATYIHTYSVRDPPPDPTGRWRGRGGGVLNASHFAVG